MLTEHQQNILSTLRDELTAFELAPVKKPPCSDCDRIPNDQKCGLSCPVIVRFNIAKLTRQIRELTALSKDS